MINSIFSVSVPSFTSLRK